MDEKGVLLGMPMWQNNIKRIEGNDDDGVMLGLSIEFKKDALYIYMSINMIDNEALIHHGWVTQLGFVCASSHEYDIFFLVDVICNPDFICGANYKDNSNKLQLRIISNYFWINFKFMKTFMCTSVFTLGYFVWKSMQGNVVTCVNL